MKLEWCMEGQSRAREGGGGEGLGTHSGGIVPEDPGSSGSPGDRTFPEAEPSKEKAWQNRIAKRACVQVQGGGL